jgi:hypothetical protein
MLEDAAAVLDEILGEADALSNGNGALCAA